MKFLPFWGLALLLTLVGCMSKAHSKAQAQAAFQAGQMQGLMQAQPAAPTVTFRGDVKNRTIPWTEDLTLGQALLAAEYQGTLDPHTIVVVRQGTRYPVNPRHLLSGQENPALEPGDIVEVKR
jgi:hypothetical protein